MDLRIENLVKSCEVCQKVRSLPQKIPLIPWQWPGRPFQRIHLDFCDFDRDKFLVLVDSYSKWIDVKCMNSTNALSTIDELRLMFSEHGIPEEIVTDNGPPFQSIEFREFVNLNAIKHVFVPPYHPASNGAAERSVRLVKESLKKTGFAGYQRYVNET